MFDQLAYNISVSLVESGRIQEAEQSIITLINKSDKQALYWYLYSVIALRLKRPTSAIEYALKATQLEASPEFYIQLAMAYQHNINFSEALRVADLTSKMTITSAYQWNALGNVYSSANNTTQAELMYVKSVESAPNIHHFQFNLATALRANGKLEQAEQCYDKIVALKPNDYEALYNRSQLRKQTIQKNHINVLDKALQSKMSKWRDEVHICFALAKEQEDVADYANSFSHLKRGCDLRRKNSNYNVEGDLQAIKQIINTFNSQSFNQKYGGFQSKEPIFVLGLPRTGTTLVERILSSHSDIESAGELQNFATKMVSLISVHWSKQKTANSFQKSNMISTSFDIDHAALGEAYIDSTRPLTGGSKHFIDKMPLNYLYIGLIAKALPNAKIIHLTRHPLDTCYAIYKTLFKDAYPFSYSLEDLGRYYLEYQKLMQHWHQVLPGKILNVSYEKLVSNQEYESRRLIEFCDLEWQSQCLSFYNNPQPSTTASSVQVRQPIYKSSIEKWKHYEQSLQPLIDMFTDEGIKF
ncbi:MAG: tetratricopeptide (TPR) repeat protein [Colwellia sp.]|jgi:tetratricopeptide (TPR) repeat protein